MQYLVEAGNLLKETLSAQSSALLKRASVVNIEGSYDHAERILEHVDTEFKSYSPNYMPFLTSNQVCVINCPGKGINPQKIAGFVRDGGWLFTTDWVIHYLIEAAFPRTIKRLDGISTGDDVVKIEAERSPITEGLNGAPEFWIDGSSWGIEPVSPHIVPILKSQEFKQLYGSDLIMAGFKWGYGRVFHTTSHVELQRSRAGGTRLEDAYSSLRLLSNVIIQKQAENIRKKYR